MCENIEKTVKNVSQPFFSHKLLFFRNNMVHEVEIIRHACAMRMLKGRVELHIGGLAGRAPNKGGDWRGRVRL